MDIMSENVRVHFKIALPASLKQKLEHEAVDRRRSLSAEIISRLEASIGRDNHELAIATLLGLHDELIVKDRKISVDPIIGSRVIQLADEYDVSPEKLMNLLITQALEHIKNRTPVGNLLAAKLNDMHLPTAPDEHEIDAD